ncbi:MAG: ABC-type transport auxiliary lipoprotein component [Pseudomonadota bacterium]|jgi:ABC-type uncharacterized transport system auxiliary subunit
MKSFSVPMLLAALCLTAAGCFGPRAQVTRAFELELPAEAQARPDASAPVVRVRDLDPSAVVDRDSLVLRQSAVELRFPEHLRWARRPHRLIADALGRALVDRGLASSAPRTLADLKPTFELDGRLDVCEQDLSSKSPLVRLGWTLTLRRFADGRIVWRHVFFGSAPSGAEPEAGVAALSKLVQRALGAALDGLGKSDALRQPAPADAPQP